MDEVMRDIEDHAYSAHMRYGSVRSTHEAIGVALEEWTELLEAVRENDIARVRSEAIDLAAVLVRLAREESQDFINRSTK